MAASIQIKKISPWMERLADLLIANPELSQNEIAEKMGRSPTWLSIVKNSDTFQDYWRERSNAHSEMMSMGIKAKAFAATERALDALNIQLELGAETMQTSTLLEVIDITQKRFGYGPEAQNAPQINFNLGLVTPEQLAEARKKLRTVQEAQIIELKPNDTNKNGE